VRRLLHLRRSLPALVSGSWRLREAPPGVLAYHREGEDETFLVALNFRAQPARLELAAEVLLSTFLDREGWERSLELRGHEGLLARLRA
jgi:alpha-glucosidase